MAHVITDSELQTAKEVVDYAMLVGWEKAINDKATELGVDDLRVRDLLNKVSENNVNADATWRIDGLEDWEQEKLGRSERSFRASRP